MYGENTIEHILTGKAYARAIRGHFVIQQALIKLLVKFLTRSDPCDSSDPCIFVTGDTYAKLAGSVSQTVVEDLNSLFEQSLTEGALFDSNQLLQSDSFTVMLRQLDSLKCALLEQSRTRQLWIRYIDHVNFMETMPNRHVCTFSRCLACLKVIHGYINSF
jgi:hypothetical protein